MIIPWRNLIVIVIEIALLTLLTVRLAANKASSARTLTLSFLYAPALLFMRTYLVFGFHTVISFVLYPLLLGWLEKIAYRRVIRGFVLSVCLLLAAETISRIFLKHILGLAFTGHILIAVFSQLLLLLTLILVYVRYAKGTSR